jgi:hypothetical protein
MVFRKRNGTIVRVKSVKYVPPDVSAAELWLSDHTPDLPSEEKNMIAYLQSFIAPARRRECSEEFGYSVLRD